MIEWWRLRNTNRQPERVETTKENAKSNKYVRTCSELHGETLVLSLDQSTLAVVNDFAISRFLTLSKLLTQYRT